MTSSRTQGLVLLMLLTSCGLLGCDCVGTERVKKDAGTRRPPFDGGVERAECRLPQDPTPELAQAAYAAVVTNAHEGLNSAPLTPDGCIEIRRYVQGGALTRLELVTWGLTLPVADGLELIGFRNEHLLGQWDYDATGSIHGVVDGDRDGRADAELVRELDANGNLVRSVWTEFVYLFVNGSSTQYVWYRSTTTVLAPGTLHLKVEQRDVGQRLVAQEYDFPQKQNACTVTDAEDSEPVDCNADEKAQIATAMFNGFVRISRCLNAAGADKLMQSQVAAIFHAIFSKGYLPGCFTGKGSSAWTSVPIYQREGQLQINVNRERLPPCVSFLNFESTVTHEVLHQAFQAGHEPYDVIEKPDWQSHHYSDRNRGCEAMCFGGPQINTKCACAACLGTLACDPRCASRPMCCIKDGGLATMSEAVGAECRNPDFDAKEGPHSDGGNPAGSWFQDLLACQSGCQYGPAHCKSRSLSCDPTCN